eukprot:6212425-Pleurochrysis_carterae.AAC.6
MHGKSDGPAQMVKTRGYLTTMALSTLKNLLATQELRRGEGMVSVPESRRNERLFGMTGAGRTNFCSASAQMLKLEQEYQPREDTCVSAFVRLMAEVATMSAK